jgi:plasmid stability protein
MLQQPAFPRSAIPKIRELEENLEAELKVRAPGNGKISHFA